MKKNRTPVVMRLHERANRVLAWFRNNAIVALIIAFMGGVILIGKTAENLMKIISPFFRASTEASQVAEIRKDVERQRDAIGVIERDANAAQARIEEASRISKIAQEKAEDVVRRSDEIQQLANKAASAVETIRTTSDFSFVLAKAAADDREAFDDLIAIFGQPSHKFQALAQSALLRIVGEDGSKLQLEPDWQKHIGVDPATADFAEMKEIFESRPMFDKAAVLRAVWNQERFPKYDRLTFLRDIIVKTPSISVLAAACRAMDGEARIHKNVIGYREYLEWWAEHIRDYTPAADLPHP
jgi:hypothetical protein